MIAVIDYGVGNLFSLKSSLAAIGQEAAVTQDRAVIRSCSHVILPGVGAFGDAADKLRKTGMADGSAFAGHPSADFSVQDDPRTGDRDLGERYLAAGAEALIAQVRAAWAQVCGA